ncbi:hypothetical protein [Bacillus thuringiensis]|uniref:hypothetical protein n=1 Tax=Bacillus thuringiensis TaxID=1428 RepID=UPI000BFC1054|nr:hypothetical protein [Bacillus thuringiensis]PGU19083.1 hypothetical protein COD23_08635 [Bacillus thuringiensis]
MKKSLINLKQLTNCNCTVEIPHFSDNNPHFSDDIIVSENILMEVGYEIRSNWEDGRIHTENDSLLLEAKIVDPQGNISVFLNITVQELVRNAQQNVPFFKKVNPLIGLDAGQYSIVVRATSICLFCECIHNELLFSLTPIVKIYINDASVPLVNIKDTLDCNLVGHVTTGCELSKVWTVYYKES